MVTCKSTLKNVWYLVHFNVSAQDADLGVFTQYADIGFLLLNTQLDLQNHREPSGQKF